MLERFGPDGLLITVAVNQSVAAAVLSLGHMPQFNQKQTRYCIHPISNQSHMVIPMV